MTTKLTIGDRVKVIKDSLDPFSQFTGLEGKITDESVTGHFQVKFDKTTEFGSKFYFYPDELQKVE